MYCESWSRVGADLSRSRSDDVQQSNPQETQDDLMNLMTIMYIVIQETLNDPEDMSSTYGKLRTSPALHSPIPRSD